MSVRKVLVTGANGLIGGIVRRYLRGTYELSYLTREPAAYESHVANLCDLEAIQPAFAAMDAVVHLAASSAVDSSWEDVLADNIIGTRNVFEAARVAGVPRIVFASSSHVVGTYEREGAPAIYDLGDARVYDERVSIRPDSLYGASKAFGEALGRLYSDQFGIHVVCLRIGSVRASPTPTRSDDGGIGPAPAGFADTSERLRATWLSYGDCAELIRCALDSDARWAIAYGTSDNPRQLWDLRSARDLLAYHPRDAAPVRPEA